MYERPRFYGIYRAVVVSNSDPINKGRIKVLIPQVLGDNTTGWLEACLPVILQVSTATTNNAAITTTGPEIGKGVWVMFESGDPDYPVWVGVSS